MSEKSAICLNTVKIGSVDALEERVGAGEPADATTTPASQQSPGDRVPAPHRPRMRSNVSTAGSHASRSSLGKDMADDLGATVGSVVLVTSPQGELTPFGMVPKYTRFRVAGIFNSGFFDYDSSLGFHPPLRRAAAVRPGR